MIAWNNRWNCLVLASSEFHWYWIVYVASVSETSGGCGNSDCGYWSHVFTINFQHKNGGHSHGYYVAMMELGQVI